MKSKMITKVIALLVALCGLQVFGAAETISWSNTNTSNTVSADKKKTRLIFRIPATQDLPVGSVVKITKLRLAATATTFANGTMPSFLMLNKRQSDGVNGTSPSSSSNAGTLYDTKVIDSNTSTQDRALEFTWNTNPCYVMVGMTYGAAPEGSYKDDEGLILLHNNGNALISSGVSAAVVRYVQSNDSDSILSGLSDNDGYYPVYNIEADIVYRQPNPNANGYATWLSSSGLTFHSGTFDINGTNFVGSTDYTTLPGWSGTSKKTWHLFASPADTSNCAYIAPGTALNLVGIGEEGNFDAKFTPLHFGGLMVSADAKCTGFVCTGGRQTRFGDTNIVGGVATYFDFYRDFRFDRDGNMTIYGDASFMVAEGKSVSLNTNQTTTLTLDTTTSGKLRMKGAGSLYVKTLVATGNVELDYSALDGQSRTDSFLHGTIQVNASTKYRFAADPSKATQTLATTITGATDGLTTAKVALGSNAAADTPVMLSLSSGTMTLPQYATISASTDWSKLSWDKGSTLTSPIAFVKVEDDATVTVDSSVTLSNITFNVASGKTLTISGSNAITASTLITIAGSGTVVADAGCLSGPISVSNGATLTMKGGGTSTDTKTYAGTVTVVSGGTFKTEGYLNLSSDANKVYGTLDVASGVLNFGTKHESGAFAGTVYVRKGAELDLPSIDMADTLSYGSTVDVYVYGKLDMGKNRWTLMNTNTIYLYPGAELAGDGQTKDGTELGALDAYGNAVTIYAKKDGTTGDTATLSAKLRPRNASGFTFDVEEGMELVLSGTDGDYHQGFTKKGAGTLTISGQYSLKGAVTVSEGGINYDGGSTGAGTLTVNSGASITVTSGTYDLSKATINGTVTVGAATVTLPSSIDTSSVTLNSGAVATIGETVYTSADLSELDLHRFICETNLTVFSGTYTAPTKLYGRTATPVYDTTDTTKLVSIKISGPTTPRTLTAPTGDVTWGYETKMTDADSNTAYFFNGDTVKFTNAGTVTLASGFSPVPAEIEVTGGSLKMTTKLYPVKVNGGEYISNDSTSNNGVRNVTDATGNTSGGDAVYVKQNTGANTIYFYIPSGAFMKFNQWADQEIAGVSGRGTLVKTGDNHTLSIRNPTTTGYTIDSTAVVIKRGSIKLNNNNSDPRIKGVTFTIDSSYNDYDSGTCPIDNKGWVHADGTITLAYDGTTAVSILNNDSGNAAEILAIDSATFNLAKSGTGEIDMKNCACVVNGTTTISGGTLGLAGTANEFKSQISGSGKLKLPTGVEATESSIANTITVTGAGKLKHTVASKTTNEYVNWTWESGESGWTGTYVLSGLEASIDNWNPNTYYNGTNSTFQLDGVITGGHFYQPTTATTEWGELILDGTSAITNKNGYSKYSIGNVTYQTNYKFKKLTGSGSFTYDGPSNCSAYQAVQFCDITEFTGSITSAGGSSSYGARFILGKKDQYTLDDNTPAKGSIAIIGDVTVKCTLTAKSGIKILEGATATMSGGKLASTVSGAGTIVCDIDATDTTKVAPTGLNDASGWTGTVIISAVNKALSWGDFGNASSKIVFNGVSGWPYTSGGYDTFTGTVEMRDKDTTPALNISAGSSGCVLKFTTVTGDGTVKATGTDSTKQSYGLLGNISGFTGTISTTANYGWMTGTTTGTLSDILGKIIISAGTEATIVDGKTWVATSGIVVNGTLTLAGSSSAMPNLAGGSGKIIAQGKIPNNSGLAASTWTGTLEVPATLTQTSATQVGNAGSTLSITAGTTTLSAATSLPGTVSITAGAALKVPSSCAAPTSLVTTGAAIVATTADSVTTYTAYATIADALAAVGDSGSLKLFSDVTNAGALTIGEGATLDLNGKSVSGLKLLGGGTITDTATTKGSITFADGTAFTGTIPAGVTLNVTAGTVNLVGATILGNNTINNNGGTIQLDRKAVVTVVDDTSAADNSVQVVLTTSENTLGGFTTEIKYGGAKAGFYVGSERKNDVSVNDDGYLYDPASTQTVTWVTTKKDWYDTDAWQVGSAETTVTWFDGCQTPVTLPDGSSITLTKAVATTNVTIEGTATLIGASYVNESAINAEAKIASDNDTVTYYKTLASAISAAEDGAEVILMKGVTLSSAIPSFSTKLTINLNSYLLQGAISTDDLLSCTATTLTIKNGTLFNGAGATLLVNGTTLTLDNVIINAGGSLIDVGDNGATINVDTNGATLSMYGYGIKATGSVTITGEGELLMGPAKSGLTTLAIQSISATAPTITIENTNTTIMATYALYAKSSAEGVSPKLDIDGGKYAGSISQIGSSGSADANNREIKGGIYTTAASTLSAFVNADYLAVSNTDTETSSWQTIVISSSTVATLGLTQYTSFTDAVNAAVTAGVAVSTITVRRTDDTALKTMPAGYTLKDGKIAEDTTTWTGNGGDNDNWTTAANWDNGVPTTNSRAVINLAEGKTMTFDCATTPFSVTFSGEGTVKVTALPTDKFKTALESTDWTGTLEYVVSTDKTLATTDTITCNGTFKKSGTGTLSLSAVNQIAGTTKVWVSEGVLKNYGTSSPSPGTTAFSDGTALVTISEGGTVDLNGAPMKRPVSISGTGYNGQGLIMNSSSQEIDGTRFPLKTTTLTGDATIHSSTNGVNKAGNATVYYKGWYGIGNAASLVLDSYTLTKTGDGFFYFDGTTGSITGTGTIDVKEGAFKFINNDETFSEGTIIVRKGAGLCVYNDTVYGSGSRMATVKNVTFEDGASLVSDRAAADKYGTLKVTGTLTTGGGFTFDNTAASGAAKLALGRSATLKLGGCLTVNSKFTTDSSGYVIDASNMLTANGADTVQLIVTNGVLSTTGVSLIDPTGLYVLEANSTGLCATKTKEKFVIGGGESSPSINIPKTWLTENFPDKTTEQIQAALIEKPSGAGMTRAQAYALGFDDVETAKIVITSEQIEDPTKFRISVAGSPTVREGTGVAVEYKVISSPSPSRDDASATTNSMGTATSVDLDLPSDKVRYYFIDADIKAPEGNVTVSSVQSSALSVIGDVAKGPTTPNGDIELLKVVASTPESTVGDLYSTFTVALTGSAYKSGDTLKLNYTTTTGTSTATTQLNGEGMAVFTGITDYNGGEMTVTASSEGVSGDVGCTSYTLGGTIAAVSDTSTERVVQMLANTPYEDGFTEVNWMANNSTYNQYRIPGIAKATNGVAIAVYDCRYFGNQDLGRSLTASGTKADGTIVSTDKSGYSPIDIAGNESTDGGLTWSAPSIVIDVPNCADKDTGVVADNIPNKSMDLGDPCVVYDPEVHKFFLMGITGGGNSAQGSKTWDEANDCVMYERSANASTATEKQSWSEHVDPTSGGRSIKEAVQNALTAIGETRATSLKSMLQGPGHGIVTTQNVYTNSATSLTPILAIPKGTIVFPMQYILTTGTFYHFAIFSKDHGKNWEATKFMTGSGKSSECMVAELDDASWCMMVRTGAGNRQFWRTNDYINWTQCTNGQGPSFEGYGTQGGFLRIGTNKAGNSVYAAAYPTGGTGYTRSMLKVFFGTDVSKAHTDDLTYAVQWNTDGIMLFEPSTDEKGYNSMIMVDDHTLGIVYEAVRHIYFDTIDISKYVD